MKYRPKESASISKCNYVLKWKKLNTDTNAKRIAKNSSYNVFTTQHNDQYSVMKLR